MYVATRGRAGIEAVRTTSRQATKSEKLPQCGARVAFPLQPRAYIDAVNLKISKIRTHRTFCGRARLIAILAADGGDFPLHRLGDSSKAWAELWTPDSEETDLGNDVARRPHGQSGNRKFIPATIGHYEKTEL